MIQKVIMKILKEKNILISISSIGIVAFLFWFLYNPVSDLTASVEGADNRPDSTESEAEIVNIGEKFERFADVESTLTGKWTRFRGADFDNIVKNSLPLIDSWGNEGPKIKWKVSLGEGHSAPVILNGKAYIMDYEEAKKRDALRCFDLVSGKELWKRSYKVHVKRNHGMSRTTAAITDSFLVTMGPKGHAMCVNPKNGDLKWGIDLVKDYNTEIPFWYTGQCPIIDNNVAIFAPGGKALLIAVDCATGKVVWETPNPDNWQMSHSSIIPMTIKGKRMYVYASVGGVIGVSAEGDDIGKLLWKNKEYSPSVVAPSPLALDDSRILITAGYGAGSAVLQVSKNGASFSAKMIQKYRPSGGIASEQQTPILYNGHVFGILPKDAGGNRNQLVVTKASDPSKILWTSGKENRFGLGPYVIADNKFFILNDDGTLNIAKLSTQKFTLLDKARVIEGHDAWGPLAIADGYLIMRDSKTMLCLDIRK